MSFKHLVLPFRQLIFYGFFCDVFFFGVCHTLSLKSQFVMNLYIYHVSVIKRIFYISGHDGTFRTKLKHCCALVTERWHNMLSQSSKCCELN